MARTSAATLNAILIEIKMMNARLAAAELAAIAKEEEAVGAAAVKANEKIAASSKGLKAAAFNAGLFGKGLDLIKKAGKGLALTGIAGVGASIFSGISFEQEMAKVKSITVGASGVVFDEMKKRALEATTFTRFSAKQAAEAMYLLGRAGFTATQELRAMGPVLNLAHAAAIPLALSAEVMGEALRGFSLDAKDAGLVTDTLAQAIKGGAVNINDLRYSIKYIGSMAVATNQPLSVMVGLLEVMARHGIKGSQAGTTLRSVMTRLTRPVKMVKDGLSLLNMQSKDLYGPHGLKPLNVIFDEMRKNMKKLDPVTANKAISMILGQWASSGGFAILNTPAAQVKKFIDDLKKTNVKGVAAKIAHDLNNTVEMQLLRIVHVTQAIGIGFYQMFDERIKNKVHGIADSLSDLLGFMDSFSFFIKKGDWQSFARLVDIILTGRTDKLAPIIMEIVNSIKTMYHFAKDILWPVMKDLAIVIGATLYLAFKLVIGIMRIMDGHTTTSKALIWLIIFAYTAWKIAMWANTAAVKLNTMWTKRAEFWRGLLLIRTWASTAAEWLWTAAKWAGNAALGFFLILASKAFWSWVWMEIKLIAVTAWEWLCAAGAYALTAAMWLLNIAMDANPIMLVIIALIAIGVAFYLLYTKVGWFHHGVIVVWTWIGDHWPLLLAILVGPLGIAIGQIIQHWDTLKSFFMNFGSNMKRIGGDIWSWLRESFVDIVNSIIHIWNTIGFKFHVLGYGDVNISTPDLGYLAGGSKNGPGARYGGSATVDGVKGSFPPKVLDPVGPSVGGGGGGGWGPDTIHTTVKLNDKVLATAVHKRDSTDRARRDGG